MCRDRWLRVHGRDLIRDRLRVRRAQRRRGRVGHAAHDAIARALAERLAGEQGLIRVLDELAVGLDLDRLGRAEHEAVERCVDMERLREQPPTRRRRVLRGDRREIADRVEMARVVDRPRPRTAVPVVEGLAPPELGARRGHRHHDVVAEMGAHRCIEPLVRRERRGAVAGEVVAWQRATADARRGTVAEHGREQRRRRAARRSRGSRSRSRRRVRASEPANRR